MRKHFNYYYSTLNCRRVSSNWAKGQGQGEITFILLSDFLIVFRQKCLGPEILSSVIQRAVSCGRTQLVRMHLSMCWQSRCWLLLSISCSVQSGLRMSIPTDTEKDTCREWGGVGQWWPSDGHEPASHVLVVDFHTIVLLEWWRSSPWATVWRFE